MKTPLFDNDILCVHCGYWYTPEAFIDTDHWCAGCRRQRDRYKQQHDKSDIVKTRLREYLSEMPQDDDSYVYVFVGEKTGLAKVGYSSVSPLDRLMACQVGSPDILRYVGCFHAPIFVERELHEILNPFHSHGEWFQLPPSVFQILIKGLDRQIVNLLKRS